MRAGGCTVQQTLTAEAAGVVKHAVALARRRGHAQVTPLHVAATLLAPGASVLRRACEKSHPHSTSHPLQCRALELCFNVALNRRAARAGPAVAFKRPRSCAQAGAGAPEAGLPGTATAAAAVGGESGDGAVDYINPG